jgi:hypothetical protein
MMRHLQQPNANPEANLVAELIQRLSPERRRDLVGTAAQNRLLELIDAHQKATIDDFFRAVQADQHWPLLKSLLLSEVILSSAQAAKDPAAASPAEPDRPTAERRQMRLSILPTSPVEADAEALPARAKPSPEAGRTEVANKAAATRKRSGDILDDIVKLLETKPGLRNEEIQKQLGKPAVLVKTSLAALRKGKRVRTEGERRATRYFASA